MRDGVHVDPGARGGDVDRRADPLRDRERLGDRVEQHQIARRRALLDVRGEAGDVVDAELGAGAIERLGQRHVGGGARRLADERNRRDRDALVGDGHTERAFDFFGDVDEAARRARDLVVDALAGAMQIVGGAVAQRDAHGDGADVEVLGLDHPQRRAQLFRFPDGH